MNKSNGGEFDEIFSLLNTPSKLKSAPLDASNAQIDRRVVGKVSTLDTVNHLEYLMMSQQPQRRRPQPQSSMNSARSRAPR